MNKLKTLIVYARNGIIYLCNMHKRTFIFNGKRLRYLWRRYNTTWLNERQVEVPIICDIIKDYKTDRILEIGNVLSHYIKAEHDIVDLYEVADGVINEDAETFKTEKKYDLIVSISTIEHIGWDDGVDAGKIKRTMRNLWALLLPGGKLVITFPVGYNHIIDNMMWNGDYVEYNIMGKILGIVTLTKGEE